MILYGLFCLWYLDQKLLLCPSDHANASIISYEQYTCGHHDLSWLTLPWAISITLHCYEETDYCLCMKSYSIYLGRYMFASLPGLPCFCSSIWVQYNTQKKKNGVFHKPRNKKTRPGNEARYMLSKVQWDIKPGYWVVMRATIFCTYWIVYICSQRAERCPVSSVLSWLVQWHSPTLHIHVSQNVGKN